MATTVPLPSIGFLRLPQIIGDRNSKPPTPAIFPVSRSSWWEGVRLGKYPKPIKLSENVTAWKVEDVRALIERVGAQGGAS
jgi:prophage regulatory protein